MKIRNDRGIKTSLIMLLTIGLLLLSVTFAWFSTNVKVINGKLALGSLKAETVVYANDGITAVLSVDEEGNSSVNDMQAPGLIYNDRIANYSYAERYLVIKNTGSIDARAFLSADFSFLDDFSVYDLNYFYLQTTDITSQVEAKGSLAAYAADYVNKTCIDANEFNNAYYRNSYQLSSLADNSIVLGDDGLVKTGETRYFKIAVVANGITDKMLVDKAGKALKIDANILIQQESAPYPDQKGGETFEISSADAFLSAVRSASDGDTIMLTNDVIFTDMINVSIYHLTNIDLNGYRLTINGNLKYDSISKGQVSVLTGGGILTVNGDFVIDVPNASFELNGNSGGHVAVGGIFEADCTRNVANPKEGYNQNNLAVLSSDGLVKDLIVDSSTRVNINYGSKLGLVVAKNASCDIAISNYGIIKYADLSAMKYWRINEPEQLYFENAGEISIKDPAVILPAWARGRVTSVDEEGNSYQVNATLVKLAGAKMSDWTCAVLLNSVKYSGSPVDEANGSVAGSIFFWNQDITYEETIASSVTRVKAGEYIVRYYDESDNLESLLNAYYLENPEYQDEDIKVLSLRTYDKSTVKEADFSKMCSFDLVSLDLSSTNLENNLIPDYALKNAGSLEKVYFPNTEYAIGKEAFYGCNIEEATLNSALTSVGSNAFVRKDNKNTYITWDSSSQITKAILDGFGMNSGKTNVRLFMNENLLSTVGSVSTTGINVRKCDTYAYERYDFIDQSSKTFVKILSSNYCKIVYYEGEYSDNMIGGTFAYGNVFNTYSIGTNAYRLIGSINSNTANRINLSFPDSLKVVGNYAFYVDGGKYCINELSLNNVNRIGEYAFYGVDILRSNPRSEAYTGMEYLGDNSFGFMVLGPANGISLELLESIDGDKMIAGTFDISANKNANVFLSRLAFRGCKVSAANVYFRNYQAIGALSGSGGLGSSFSAVKLDISNTDYVASDAFSGAFGQTYGAYNVLVAKNVKSIGQYAFNRTHFNEVIFDISDDNYTQAQVDNEYSWTISGNHDQSPFYLANINNLHISGYIPAYKPGTNTKTLFTSVVIKNLLVDNLSEDTAICDYLFRDCIIDNIEIKSAYDLVIGSNAFSYSTLGSVVLSSEQNIQLNNSAFQEAKINDHIDIKAKGSAILGNNAFYKSILNKLGRYSYEDGWKLTNQYESIGSYALSNCISSADSLNLGDDIDNPVYFDFSKTSYIGTCAFDNVKYGLNPNTVISDECKTIGANAFRNTNIQKFKANGITSIGNSYIEFILFGDKDLLELEVKGVLDLPQYTFYSVQNLYSLKRVILGENINASSNCYFSSNPARYDMVIEVASEEAKNRIAPRFDGVYCNIAVSDEYIYAYDTANYDIEQFNYNGIQMPQYLLKKNSDGTYRITNVHNPYWSKQDLLNGTNTNLQTPSSFVLPINYDGLTIPSVLKDIAGNSYEVSGIDYQAIRVDIHGDLVFSEGIRQFGYSDSKTISQIIIDDYSSNLTSLEFLAGGTYANPANGQRMNFLTNAFYGITLPQVEELVLNHATLATRSVRLVMNNIDEVSFNDIDNASCGIEIYSNSALSFNLANSTIRGNFRTIYLTNAENFRITNTVFGTDEKDYYFWECDYNNLKNIYLNNVEFKSFAGWFSKRPGSIEKIEIIDCPNLPEFKWDIKSLVSINAANSKFYFEGSLESLKDIKVDNCTFTINGDKNALEHLDIRNSTINGFTGSLQNILTITLEGDVLPTRFLNGKTMNSLVSIDISKCKFGPSVNYHDLILSSINAPALTSLSIRNCTYMSMGDLANMVVAEDCYVTLSGNEINFVDGNQSSWNNERNIAKFNIPEGTLDLSRQHSLIYNGIYGDLGTVILPDSSLEMDADHKDNPANLSIFNNITESIFTTSNAALQTKVKKLVVNKAGDLNNYVHIGGADIEELVFSYPIDALPYGFDYGGSISKVTFSDNQPLVENSIAITFHPSTTTSEASKATNTRIWAADYSKMSQADFEKLYYLTDTSAYPAFSYSTFPVEIENINFASGQYRINNDYQYYNVTFAGLKEMDLAGFNLNNTKVFEGAKFNMLATLRLGTVSSEYVFNKTAFDKLENLDLSSANIISNRVFNSCKFNEMRELVIDNVNAEYFFIGCTFPKLETITIEKAYNQMFNSASLPALATIVNNSNCYNGYLFDSASLPALQSLDLRGKNVEMMAFMSANLSGLTQVLTDENTSFLGHSNFHSANLSSLKEATWYRYVAIPSAAFFNVIVPDNAVWEFPDAISFAGTNAFSKIKTGSIKLLFPNFTSFNKAINFEDSTAIEKIVFGPNLNSVSRNGEFKGMTGTICFEYDGVVGTDTGENMATGLENLKLSVPGNRLAEYKSSAIWTAVKDRIYASSLEINNWLYKYVGSSDNHRIQIISYAGNDSASINSLIIPDKLIINDEAYAVVDLAPDILDNVSNINNLSIPSSVVRIDSAMFDGSKVATISIYQSSSNDNCAYATENGIGTGKMLLSGDGTTLIRYMPGNDESGIVLNNRIIAVCDGAFRDLVATSIKLEGVQYLSSAAFAGSNFNTIRLSVDLPPIIMGNVLYDFIDNAGNASGNASIGYANKQIIVAGLDAEGNPTDEYLNAYRSNYGFLAYAVLIQKDDSMLATKTNVHAKQDETKTDGLWSYRIEGNRAILVDYSGEISAENNTISVPASVNDGENNYIVSGFAIVDDNFANVISYGVDNSIGNSEIELVAYDGILYRYYDGSYELLRYPAGRQNEIYDGLNIDGSNTCVEKVADNAFRSAIYLREIRLGSEAMKNLGTDAFALTHNDLIVVMGDRAATLKLVDKNYICLPPEKSSEENSGENTEENPTASEETLSGNDDPNAETDNEVDETVSSSQEPSANVEEPPVTEETVSDTEIINDENPVEETNGESVTTE